MPNLQEIRVLIQGIAIRPSLPGGVQPIPNRLPVVRGRPSHHCADTIYCRMRFCWISCWNNARFRLAIGIPAAMAGSHCHRSRVRDVPLCLLACVSSTEAMDTFPILASQKPRCRLHGVLGGSRGADRNPPVLGNHNWGRRVTPNQSFKPTPSARLPGFSRSSRDVDSGWGARDGFRLIFEQG